MCVHAAIVYDSCVHVGGQWGAVRDNQSSVRDVRGATKTPHRLSTDAVCGEIHVVPRNYNTRNISNILVFSCFECFCRNKIMRLLSFNGQRKLEEASCCASLQTDFTRYSWNRCGITHTHTHTHTHMHTLGQCAV
jgi:hypothetical protein